MNIVYIVKGMPSADYENSDWIEGIYDSEDKAYVVLSKLEELDVADEAIYTIEQWELL